MQIQMEFRADNPGAVQYGNFINYYTFNSAEERLKLLPTGSNIWTAKTEDNNEPYLVLDVGCNSGVYTQLLYEFIKKETNRNVIILGIDIDPILIERAKSDNKYVDNIFFETCNVMSDEQYSNIQDFLTLKNRQEFDAVFCLSITMWIHLNNSDIGLKKFLEKLSNISKALVIEPQPWKCYLTAVKRMKKANETFPYFSDLKWRNNVENEIKDFIEINLKMKNVYSTPPTKWNRKLYFYLNPFPF